MKRVLYIGAKDLGVRCLEHLIERSRGDELEIVAVIAKPDDDEDHWYGSVSRTAREAGLPTFMPENINARAFCDELADMEIDIGFCVFHGQIFKRFLEVPKDGIINLHFAPLPLYRGCLPIPHAIMDGRTEHGVTMHMMVRGPDAGPIVGQVAVPIGPADTGFELYKRCEIAGLDLFRSVLEDAVDDRLVPVEQDESTAIYHFRNELDDRSVDPSMDRSRLFDYVRALDYPPFPRPYIDCGDGRKIYLTTIPNEMEAERNDTAD
jgi:UDP-4-amino-4-deoxy-L-arabinose formyltransferase/UDP-glucuronic acid dehydrogenase (UDP-4-keto-hexauronic acid decarboxylating)